MKSSTAGASNRPATRSSSALGGGEHRVGAADGPVGDAVAQRGHLHACCTRRAGTCRPHRRDGPRGRRAVCPTRDRTRPRSSARTARAPGRRRGCRPRCRASDSSASRCRSASRSTSTWRVGPWHAWNWIEWSAGSGVSEPAGAASARRSLRSCPSSVSAAAAAALLRRGARSGTCSTGGTPSCVAASSSRTAVSRCRRPQDRSSGCATWAAVSSSARDRRADTRAWRQVRGQVRRDHRRRLEQEEVHVTRGAHGVGEVEETRSAGQHRQSEDHQAVGQVDLEVAGVQLAQAGPADVRAGWAWRAPRARGATGAAATGGARRADGRSRRRPARRPTNRIMSGRCTW